MDNERFECDRYTTRIALIFKKYECKWALANQFPIKINGSRYELPLSSVNDSEYYIFESELRIRVPMDECFHVELVDHKWVGDVFIRGHVQNSFVHALLNIDHFASSETENTYNILFGNYIKMTLYVEIPGG